MTAETGSPIVKSALIEDGTLLRLVLNQPKGNVLTLAMMNALSDALAAQRDNSHLRMVMIRGEGKHFSFGASVEEHQKDQAPSMLAGFHKMIRYVAGYPVPIAALVEGSCLGGAFELILACHFVFADPNANLGCPEIKLGVFPPVLAAIGSYRLGGPLGHFQKFPAVFHACYERRDRNHRGAFFFYSLFQGHFRYEVRFIDQHEYPVVYGFFYCLS